MGKLLIPNFKKGGRMLSRNKDTDYLALSARIHAMEGRLLTRDRMDRMIDAREESEALKVLTECGYGGAEGLRAQDVERVLATARAETFQELSTAAPDPRVVDVFRLKYDYHNAKVLVKAEAMGIDAGGCCWTAGACPPLGWPRTIKRSSWAACPSAFKVRSGRPGRPWLPPTILSWPTWLWTGPATRRWPSWPGDRERLPPGVCPPCGGCGQPEGRRPGGPDGEGERVFIPGAAARRECVPADPGRSQGRGAERPVPERGAGPGRGAGGQGGPSRRAAPSPPVSGSVTTP